ncbi:hypothetical protein GGI17_004514 [Coemansia sp. S146]|nr:hypothetical protein GGI17_004514 [Coemansia sp. S146]
MSTMPHPADIMSSPQDIESNLSAFVRRIKQMAPLAKNVALTLTASIIDIPLFGDRHRGSLVRQICQLADNVEYNVYYHPMSMDLQPTGVRETIITDINGNDISELAMQLARRSASTLHFLGMTFCGLNNIGPLIKDAEGCYIQYPRLHKLKLANSQSLDVVQRPAFPGVVPFPVLRNLTIGSEYYFGDDTPFRGNTGTLAYLELDLNARVISVIKMRKVFTPSSHPKLHRIKLRQRAELTQTKFGTDVEFMRFVLSIGPSAPVREVYSLLGLRGLHDVIPVLANYTCLQVLGLPYSPLWLWGVFALVKALPLLSNLHTYLPSVGLLPQGVSEKRLPAYVRETYSPMGEYLRRWRIGASTGADFESTAKCVLFLALVCPNFDYAAVPEAGRELFMAHLKEMISSNGLKQHEPRLQRLLFGGWRNRGFSVKVAHTRRAIAAEAAAQT